MEKTKTTSEIPPTFIPRTGEIYVCADFHPIFVPVLIYNLYNLYTYVGIWTCSMFLLREMRSTAWVGLVWWSMCMERTVRETCTTKRIQTSCTCQEVRLSAHVRMYGLSSCSVCACICVYVCFCALCRYNAYRSRALCHTWSPFLNRNSNIHVHVSCPIYEMKERT